MPENYCLLNAKWTSRIYSADKHIIFHKVSTLLYIVCSFIHSCSPSIAIEFEIGSYLTSRHFHFQKLKLIAVFRYNFQITSFYSILYFCCLLEFHKEFLNSNEKCESCNYFSNGNLCGDFAHPFSLRFSIFISSYTRRKTIYMQIRKGPYRNLFFVFSIF